MIPFQEDLRALLEQQQQRMTMKLLYKMLQHHQSGQDLLKNNCNGFIDLDQQDDIQINREFKFELQEKRNNEERHNNSGK